MSSARLTQAQDEGAAFGVYVHWSYCAAICPYCDFNVYRDRGGSDALFDAVQADIAGWRERTGPRRARSLFLGGGTPSLLAPSDIGRLIEAVDRAWPLESDAEVTLETNPEDAAPDKLAGFRAAGVNRLSLGVQSLDDEALKALGRIHDSAAARRSVEHALRAFENVSVDMIYARTGQSLTEWDRELSDVLSLGAQHLSLYQLTIEPGTAFARQVETGRRARVDADLAADFYELTSARTAEAGMPAYEVSNHACADQFHSEHNLIYWRSGEWAGIGPGAHARLGAVGGAERRALSAVRDLKGYVARVAETGWGVESEEALHCAAQTTEFLLMGLRVTDGVSLARWEAIGGAAPPASLLAQLEKDGLLRVDADRIALTAQGRLAADRIAGMLAPD